MTAATIPLHDTTPDSTDPGSTSDAAPATGDIALAAVAAAESAVEASGSLVLLEVDPRELIVGPNVRFDPKLDKHFIASIKDRGVREPITIRRDPTGRLVVRKGQRRTLAAIEAGRFLVPALLEPEEPVGPVRGRTVDDEREIRRIVDQLEENAHRLATPDVDVVAAHHDLLDLGLTAGQIARRTHTPAKTVKATVAVATAAHARRAMIDHQLSLEHAAVLAEFDDDPDTLALLADAASREPGRFDHHAQQARDARADRQRRATLTTELTDQGHTVVDPPERLFDSSIRKLHQLRATPDTPRGTDLTHDQHKTCPGAITWIEDAYAWRPEDDRHKVVHACRDWQTHGHADRHAPDGHATEANHGTVGSGAGGMSEEAKAERRTVIANNKAWRTATTVRREWLTRFLTRKTPPADATRWITTTLAQHRPDIANGLTLANQLLNLPEAPTSRFNAWPSEPVTTAATTATAGRATVLTLGLILAALEETTDVRTWRSRPSDHISYLTALQHWGYTLSGVEQLVIATTDPDTEDPDAGEPGADEPSADKPGADDLNDMPQDHGSDDATTDVAGTEPDTHVGPDVPVATDELLSEVVELATREHD